RTLAIPPEQSADTAPQSEEPLNRRRRRFAPREHHGPQLLDCTAGAATRERNGPCVLKRDVVEQCVHAKGARAKFIWVDTHRQRQPLLLASTSTGGLVQCGVGRCPAERWCRVCPDRPSRTHSRTASRPSLGPIAEPGLMNGSDEQPLCTERSC